MVYIILLLSLLSLIGRAETLETRFSFLSRSNSYLKKINDTLITPSLTFGNGPTLSLFTNTLPSYTPIKNKLVSSSDFAQNNNTDFNPTFSLKIYSEQKTYSKTIEDRQVRAYLRNEENGFMRKAARGQTQIGGIYVVGLVGLTLMPKEVTKWSDNWIQDAGRNLRRAFTSPPVWDKDDWVINYIGHPVAGAYYYNAVRSQNAKWWQSFIFSAAQSTMWEYIIEGVAEQPSIQDLIVTPVGGMLLGESIHQATLAMRKNGYTTLEKIVVLILNPIFVINNGYRVPSSVTRSGRQ